MIFFILKGLVNYHKYNDSIPIIIFSIVILFTILMFIRPVKNDCNLINRMINEIEINDNEIDFQTFPIAMFFNLINKESMYVKAERNNIRFKLSDGTYSFNKKYTKNIYLLIYAGDEYLVPENFYENFELLKSKLESSK